MILIYCIPVHMWVHTVYLRVSFCDSLSSGVVLRRLYLWVQAQLYTASLRIHSFSQLLLSPFTPSICLQHSAEGAGEKVKTRWCVERAWMKNTSNILWRQEGTSKRINGEMSGLINLHILRSQCILIKPIVRMTTRTVSSVAQAVARSLECSALSITRVSRTTTVQWAIRASLLLATIVAAIDAGCAIGSWWAMLRRSSAAERFTAVANYSCHARKAFFFFVNRDWRQVSKSLRQTGFISLYGHFKL